MRTDKYTWSLSRHKVWWSKAETLQWICSMLFSEWRLNSDWSGDRPSCHGDKNGRWITMNNLLLSRLSSSEFHNSEKDSNPWWVRTVTIYWFSVIKPHQERIQNLDQGRESICYLTDLLSHWQEGAGATFARSEYSKSVYIKSHERYYSSPFHVCTGCREGWLAGFALLQAVLLPFGATSRAED